MKLKLKKIKLKKTNSRVLIKDETKNSDQQAEFTTKRIQRSKLSDEYLIPPFIDGQPLEHSDLVKVADLGQGAFGKVIQMKHTPTGKHVGLKQCLIK